MRAIEILATISIKYSGIYLVLTIVVLFFNLKLLSYSTKVYQVYVEIGPFRAMARKIYD